MNFWQLKKTNSLFFIFLVLTIKAQAQLVLYIGDSHSTGSFGTTLVQQLSNIKKSNGRAAFNIKTSFTCGANAHNWLRSSGWSSPCGSALETSINLDSVISKTQDAHTNSLATLISENSDISGTKLLIVQSGTNPYGNSVSSKDTDAKDTRALIDLAVDAGYKCIWIGPPQLGSAHWMYGKPVVGSTPIAQYEMFNNILNDVVTEDSKCTYIDSNDKTSRADLRPTEYHYNSNAASDWACEVFKELEPQLRNVFSAVKTEASGSCRSN